MRENIYIYIYIYRERERERERVGPVIIYVNLSILFCVFHSHNITHSY